MSYIEPHMAEGLANHRLDLLQQGPITAYRMGLPGTPTMSTLLLFTPVGIALMGDLTPERNGSVSALGYGLEWFKNEMSEGYLCEKFLEKKFVPELALRDLRDPDGLIRSDATPEQLEALDRIARTIHDYDGSLLAHELLFAGFDICDGVPGWGYHPGEAGWLCAIQRKFRELYLASLEAEASP